MTDDLTRLMTLALEQVPAGTDPEVVEAMAEAMRLFAAHETAFTTDPEFPLPAIFWLELPGGGAIPDPAGVSCILYERFPDLRIVAKDVVDTAEDSIEVSTVFLHVNHGHVWVQRPMLYETMLFSTIHFEEQRGLLMGEPLRKTYDVQVRYATREAAEEGHAKVREALLAGVSVEALYEMEILP